MPCAPVAARVDPRASPAPVEIPHAPAPARQLIARPGEAAVHLAASPAGMRPKQPARFAAGDRRECGRHCDRAAPPGRSADSIIRRRVPLCSPMACPSSAIRLTMSRVSSVMWLVDQEEGRARIRRRQRIEQRRRPHRVRPIVKGQIDRRFGRTRVDPPDRLRRPERFEQERERRGMRQCENGDAQKEEREHSSILGDGDESGYLLVVA